MEKRPLDIEEFDQLQEYLRGKNHLTPDEAAPRFTILCGGVSNRTVLVERSDGTSWVLKQALSKLRVASDWYSSPERVHREALGIRWLEKLTPCGCVPSLVFEDHEHHLLAMIAVPQPHENWKTLLLAGDVEAKLVRQFAQLLATLHSQAWQRRDELAAVFSDRSFFESLRIEPYYQHSANQVDEAANFLGELIADTRARLLTLVHGDYSPKNILVHNNRIVLLDHEVIHWGDPAFDVGFALTHLLSKAHFMEDKRREFLEAAQLFWRVYREALGLSAWTSQLEEYSVRHTLGCLLARVAGRSPLEYLNAGQRAFQQTIVVTLMQNPPRSLPQLINEFGQRINNASH
jgi:aminoglycoside phosphotransferase (APT) family kinase protein